MPPSNKRSILSGNGVKAKRVRVDLDGDDYDIAIDVEPEVEDDPHSYSTQTCQLLLPPMHTFLEQTKQYQLSAASAPSFSLVDNITARCVAFPYVADDGAIMDSETFSQLFAVRGHAFAVDSTRSYVVPLMLDFDCPQCTPRIEHPALPISSIKLICSAVLKAIKEVLTDMTDDYCIMVRPGHCGFHVYYGASVSLPVYDTIVTHLQSSVDLHDLKLDRISSFPLPFSSKHDELHYTVCVGSLDSVHIFPHSDFYDISTPTVVPNVNTTRQTILGYYQLEKSAEDDIIWQELDTQKLYLVYNTASTFCLSSHVSASSTTIKICNSKFYSTSHPLLAGYIGAPFDVEVSEADLPASNVFDNYSDCQVKNAVCLLMAAIAKQAYHDYAASPHRTVRLLAKALRFSNGGYAFYILTAFVVYLIQHRKFDSTTVFSVLRSIVGNNRDADNILRCLETCTEAPTTLSSAFEHPIQWLKRICQLIRESLTPQLIVNSSTAECALRSKMRLIKPSAASDIAFAYIGGVYVQRAIAKMQVWPAYRKVELECFKMWDGHSKEDADHVRVNIMSEMDIVTPDFNAYPYFINTSLGVFNTLTSQYMERIDLLYFTTCVGGPFFDTQLLNRISDWSTFVATDFIKNQVKYLFEFVIVPGLRFWHQTLATTVDHDAVLALCIRLGSQSFAFAERAFECYHFDDEEVEHVRRLIHVCRRQFGMITMANLQQCHVEDYNKDTPPPDVGGTFIAKVVCILDGYFEQLYAKKLYRVASAPSEPSEIDMSAVLGETCTTNLTFDKDVAFAMFSISVWCDFQADVVRDFLKVLSMYFSPSAARRFALLLIGAPKSGKSALLTLLRKFSQGSHFSVSSNLTAPKDSATAAPDVIHMSNSYAATIIEVKTMDSEYLKILTGNDTLDKRGLFCTEFTSLKPCAFLMTASNCLPVIANADEAIRERLAPFEITNVFTSTPDDVNPLLLYVKKLFLARQYSEVAMARALFWIAYSMFSAAKSPTTGLVSFSIQNKQSNKLISDILIKNNVVYNRLHKLHIVSHPSLTISYDDLKAAMENLIESLSKPLDVDKEMQHVRLTLLPYRHVDGAGGVFYRGIGRVVDLDAETTLPEVQAQESISLEELKKKFDARFVSVAESRTRLLQYLRANKHLYDVRTRTFTPQK